MITVAGVAFSITIVALTLASSQFGPRLLWNFMRDTGNQVVLGIFVATFIYCLLILRSIHSIGEQVFVPDISVTFAMAVALGNVGVLIYFIHHVSTSIQADHVISTVYRELMEHIQRHFPEELSKGAEDHSTRNVGKEQEEGRYLQVHHIAASEGGYLQAIDNSGLFEIARKFDGVIHLQYRPGQFMVTGSTLATVKCDKPLDETLASQVVNSFILGPRRTPQQDAEFAVRQLVEVAVRALSPGLNDPFTAITCIDWLGLALCSLTNRTFPLQHHYDDEGTLRLISKPLTFEGITNAAFDQIRQYGRSSVAVTIRLLETLKMIAEHARNAEQRHAILRQAAMIARAGHESLPEKNDVADVEQRYRALIEVFKENNSLGTTVPSHH